MRATLGILGATAFAIGLGGCATETIEPPMPDAAVEFDAGLIPEGETFALEWTCLDGCVFDLPLQYSDRLTLDGETSKAVFWATRCPGCNESHYQATYQRTTENCIAIGALVLDPESPSAGATEPIETCYNGTAIVGKVVYDGLPGTLQKVWRFDGVPTNEGPRR